MASQQRTAGAFDIRIIIAVLIGVYGIVLVVLGLFASTEEELAKTGGMNINLWAGVGMVLAAIAFAVWAKLKPTVVPADFEDDG